MSEQDNIQRTVLPIPNRPRTGLVTHERITAPGAMGETNRAASNETSSGRSENRRAEVKLLVNKGIVASAAN